MSDVKALHAVPLHDVSEGEADVLCPTCGTLVHVTKLRDEKYPDDAYTLEYIPVEAERAKHAALVEAAKAVRVQVGVLCNHPSGWKCSICGGTAGEGHLPSCAWHRFVTIIADLEASDD